MPGVVGATAPPGWHRGQTRSSRRSPPIDGAAPGIQATIDRANASLEGTDGTLTGIAAVDRDFLHALFGSFPYALGLVLLLTLILLTRAFRSIVLAVKAVVLNLVSLAAAFGIVVFVFQQGHGSSLWDIEATQSITAYIPVMIFAFLFGLSMDYEVFMLSRMREAYDETGSTDKAIELGLARTGKLVTSAALILMFAFLVLSTSPGYEIKSLAIGLAAGIIFDATVIRALLVPALMRLLGDANWWMPKWTRHRAPHPAAASRHRRSRSRARNPPKPHRTRAAPSRGRSRQAGRLAEDLRRTCERVGRPVHADDRPGLVADEAQQLALLAAGRRAEAVVAERLEHRRLDRPLRRRQARDELAVLPQERTSVPSDHQRPSADSSSGGGPGCGRHSFGGSGRSAIVACASRSASRSGSAREPAFVSAAAPTFERRSTTTPARWPGIAPPWPAKTRSPSR